MSVTFFLVTLLFRVCNLSLTKSFCRHVFIFPAIKLLCEDSSWSLDQDLVNGEHKVQQGVKCECIWTAVVTNSVHPVICHFETNKELKRTVSLTACNFLKIPSWACLVAVSFSIYIKKKKTCIFSPHTGWAVFWNTQYATWEIMILILLSRT